MLIKTNLLNLRITLERQLIVIVDVRELLLRQLHPTRTRDIVNASFLQQLIQLVTLIIEPSRPNLTTLIEKVRTKQLALSILIMPSLDITFERAARLDRPLVSIRRECFNGVDVAM